MPLEAGRVGLDWPANIFSCLMNFWSKSLLYKLLVSCMYYNWNLGKPEIHLSHLTCSPVSYFFLNLTRLRLNTAQIDPFFLSTLSTKTIFSKHMSFKISDWKGSGWFDHTNNSFKINELIMIKPCRLILSHLAKTMNTLRLWNNKLQCPRWKAFSWEYIHSLSWLKEPQKAIKHVEK